MPRTIPKTLLRDLASPLFVAICLFAVVDLATLGLRLRFADAIPVYGYVLLSAMFLAVAGCLVQKSLWFVARKLTRSNPRQSLVLRLSTGLVTTLPAIQFASMITAGRGISASVWKPYVFIVVVGGVVGTVLTLVEIMKNSPNLRAPRRLALGSGFFVLGLLTLALTTFHATTYLQVHLGFLLLASILLQIAVELTIRSTRPVVVARLPAVLRVVGLAALFGVAYLLSLQKTSTRASIGLTLFAHTLAAQKLTPLLFFISPIQGSQSTTIDPRQLTGTRLDRFNAPAVKPTLPGKYAGYNVVWFSSDAFRGDYVSRQVNGASLTPNLDRVVQQSAVFSEAIADHSHTSESLRSIISGKWSGDHKSGPTTSKPSTSLADRTRLPRLLRQNGYYSVANMMGGRWGERFFDKKRFPEFDRHDQPGPTCNDQLDAVEDFLANFEKKAPLFLWLHTFDTHSVAPIDKRKKTSNASDQEAYEAAVRQVDQCVGRMVSALVKNGMWDKTLFVFFADHGEALGDHDRHLQHSTCYYHDIHVPMVFRIPGLTKPRRIAHRIQLSDLLPTTANLTGLNTQGEFIEGDDLSGLLEGDVPANTRGLAFSRGNGSQYPCASVVSDSWHYIYTESGRFYELYNIDDDPNEVNNLVGAYGAINEHLRLLLDTFNAEFATPNDKASATDKE